MNKARSNFILHCCTNMRPKYISNMYDELQRVHFKCFFKQFLNTSNIIKEKMVKDAISKQIIVLKYIALSRQKKKSINHINAI